MGFLVTRGAPPSVEALEQQLSEVKNLYENEFSHSVDQQVVEEDGVKLIVTRGAPPSMEALEQQLREVKDIFEDNFGHSIDWTIPKRLLRVSELLQVRLVMLSFLVGL